MRRFARRLKHLQLRREARVPCAAAASTCRARSGAAWRSGGTPMRLAWRDRRRVRPRLVLLLDVSRSMSAVQLLLPAPGAGAVRRARRRALLHLPHAPHRRRRGAARSRSLALAGEAASAGRRLGRRHAHRRMPARLQSRRTRRASCIRAPRVIIVSDGYDTGEPELLASALATLRRRARRLVWLNPLLGRPGFRPGEPRHAGGACRTSTCSPRAPTWRASSRSCRSSIDALAMTNDELLELARELNGARRALRPGHRRARGRADLGLPGRAGDRARRRHAARLDRRRLRQGRRRRRGPKRHRKRRAAARAHQQRPDPAPTTTSSSTRCRCASNGTIELFIQPYSARSALCVLGSTPAADEARFLAERLRIRLADDARRGAGRAGRDARAGRRGRARGARCAVRRRHVLMIASRRKAERLRDVDARARHRRSRSWRGCRRRPVRTPAPRRRARSRWSRSSACSRCCAGVRRLSGRRAPARGDGGDASAAPRSSAAVPAPRRRAGSSTRSAAWRCDSRRAMHVESYEGVAYYFCCDGCWTAFRSEPAKYAAIHGAAQAGAGRERGPGRRRRAAIAVIGEARRASSRLRR